MRGEADPAAEDPSAKPSPRDVLLIPGTEVLVNGQLVLKSSLGAAYTGCVDQKPQWEDVRVKVSNNGSLTLPGQKEILIAHGQVVLDIMEPLSHARTISFKYTLAQKQAVLTSPDGLVRIRLRALSDAAYRIRSIQVQPTAAIVSEPEEFESSLSTAAAVKAAAQAAAAVAEGKVPPWKEGRPGAVAEGSDTESEEEEELAPEFQHGADEWLRVKLSLGLAGARKRAMVSLLRLRAAAAVRDPTKLERLARQAETEDERILMMREKRSLEHEGFGRQYNAHDEQDDGVGASSGVEAGRQRRGRLREHDLWMTQLGLPPSWSQARNALAARRVKKAKQRSSQLIQEPRLEWRRYYAQQRGVLERQLLLQQRQGGMPQELMHSLHREGSPLGHAAHRFPFGIGLMDGAVITTSPTRRCAPQAEAETRRSETCDADGAAPWRAWQTGCRASCLPALPALASGSRAEAEQVWPANVLPTSQDCNTHSPRPSRPAHTVQTIGTGWAARNAASLAARIARSTPAVSIPASVVELSSPFSSGIARVTKQGGGAVLPRVSLQDLDLFDPKDVHFAQAVGEAREQAVEWPGAVNGARSEYPDCASRLPHIRDASEGSGDCSSAGLCEPKPPRSPPPRLPMMRPTSRPASPTSMACRSVKSEPVPLEPPSLPAEHKPQMPPRVRRSMQAADIVEEEALLRAWQRHQHAQAANPAVKAGAEKRTFKPSPTVTPRARAAAKAARPPAVSTAELESALRSVLPVLRVEELLEAARTAPAGTTSRALLDDWGIAHGAYPIHVSSIPSGRRLCATSPHPSPPKWALGGSVPRWLLSRGDEKEEGI
jgi:hypothetical protein